MVQDLMLAYSAFADAYYRKNGEPTGEYDAIRYSWRRQRALVPGRIGQESSLLK